MRAGTRLDLPSLGDNSGLVLLFSLSWRPSANAIEPMPPSPSTSLSRESTSAFTSATRPCVTSASVYQEAPIPTYGNLNHLCCNRHWSCEGIVGDLFRSHDQPGRGRTLLPMNCNELHPRQCIYQRIELPVKLINATISILQHIISIAINHSMRT